MVNRRGSLSVPTLSVERDACCKLWSDAGLPLLAVSCIRSSVHTWDALLQLTSRVGDTFDRILVVVGGFVFFTATTAVSHGAHNTRVVFGGHVVCELHACVLGC